MTILECTYRKDNLDLIYDANEETFYLSLDGGGGIDTVCCSPDYTKEEIIAILKDMVKVLED